MRTNTDNGSGWIRGRQCQKASFAASTFVCVLCSRRSKQAEDLCFPVPTSVLVVKEPIHG